MDRRAFLRAALAGTAGLAIDWEKLLWQPKPLITVPAVRGVTIADLNAVTLREVFPGVVDNFFTQTPLLQYLRAHCVVELDGRSWVPIRGPVSIPFRVADLP